MRRISAVVPAVVSIALAACGGDGSNNGESPVTPTSPPQTAVPTKNVVFFLGDGMGLTTLTAARIYKVGEEGDLTIDTMPESGFIRTYSNDAQVTDSAPSMAAYMTGVKMNNEVISMTAETRATDASGKAYVLSLIHI